MTLRQLGRLEAVQAELEADEELRGALVAAFPHLEASGRQSFVRDRTAPTKVRENGGPVIERGPELDAFIGAAPRG